MTTNEPAGTRFFRFPASVPIVAGLATLISFAGALFIAPHSAKQLIGDSPVYYGLGREIAEQHSYMGVSYWPPGYPAFLALIRLVAGRALLPIYAAQSLLLGITLLFVYRIIHFVTRSHQPALLTIIACALWPPISMMPSQVMTEMLACALATASAYVWILTIDKPTVGRGVLTGVLIAATFYVKAAALPFILIAALFVLLHKEQRRLRLVVALVTVIACVLSIAPWTFRNYRVTGVFVPVATGGGFNFWLGNWPEFHRMRWHWREYPPEVAQQLKGKSETQQDRVLMSLGLQYIREDPLRATVIFLRKFGYFWLGSFGTDPGMAGNPIPHIGNFGIPKRSFAHVPLFILAVIGFFSAPKDVRRRAYPLVGMAGIWTLIYVAIHSVPRQALPVTFYEIAFAVFLPWYRYSDSKSRGKVAQA